jgi:hypothetical protein
MVMFMFMVIFIIIFVRMNKSRMLACIVLQCRYHYLSMFLTISQPPDLITEPATWHFNNIHVYIYNHVHNTPSNPSRLFNPYKDV